MVSPFMQRHWSFAYRLLISSRCVKAENYDRGVGKMFDRNLEGQLDLGSGAIALVDVEKLWSRICHFTTQVDGQNDRL